MDDKTGHGSDSKGSNIAKCYKRQEFVESNYRPHPEGIWYIKE